MGVRNRHAHDWIWRSWRSNPRVQEVDLLGPRSLVLHARCWRPHEVHEHRQIRSCRQETVRTGGLVDHRSLDILSKCMFGFVIVSSRSALDSVSMQANKEEL